MSSKVCAMLAIAVSFALLAGTGSPGYAEGALPTCARAGSPTVSIGGRPALRLSDVAACPQTMIEIVPGMMIDGQPLVHLNPDVAAGCAAAAGNPSVNVAGRPAQTTGDVVCPLP